MRNFTGLANSVNWDIDYPDSVAFAFNPQYINIKKASGNFITVNMVHVRVSYGGTTRQIDVYLIKGKAQIRIDNILQLFFDNYLNLRSINCTITLRSGGSDIFTASILTLWGGISLGERFHNVGVYDKVDAWHYQKTRIWFKNFPFTVSMFSEASNPTVCGLYDNTKEVELSTYGSRYLYPFGHSARYGIFEMVPYLDFPNAKKQAFYRIGDIDEANTFDYTFDYTFHGSGVAGQLFRLIVDERRDGFYLRWIDKFGQIQYFLFSKGETSLKNTLDKYEVPEDNVANNGLYFPNTGRVLEITGEETCSCSAVSLPDEIYEYVSTIVTSPYIDLLVSYDSNSQQIWIPVNIVSSSFDYRQKEKLHDLTISFTKPVRTKPLSGSVSNSHTMIDGPRPTGTPLMHDEKGYYIRWTDFLGSIHYRYFTKGDVSIKNTLDKSSASIEDIRVGNNNFGNIRRNIQVSGVETIKCCAVGLPEEFYEDYATIVRATKIDLYLGSTPSSGNIWMPINIVSASHVFNHSERLHDLIISFTKPAINTQTI